MSKDTLCSACVAEQLPEPKKARSRGMCPMHYQRAVRAGAFEGMDGETPCPLCVAEKAPNVKPVFARGMCRSHYTRLSKSGELEPAYAPRGSAALCTACLNAGEERPAHAKGLCASHYGRAYRGSDDTQSPIRKAPSPTCTFEGGCDNSSSRDSLCAGHKSQLKRGKPLTPLRSYKRRSGPCGVPDCEFLVSNDGLCRTHYGRKLDGEADWDRPIKEKAPDGSGHTDKYGYRFISIDGKFKVSEHRYEIEQLLGRPLTDKEDVHHINGNRSDNRTNGPLRMAHGKLRSGNLEIWSTKQPRGQEIGPKLDWAGELQEEYREFLTKKHLARMAAVLRQRGYRVERERDGGRGDVASA